MSRLQISYPTSLGKLAILPAEIRLEIYKFSFSNKPLCRRFMPSTALNGRVVAGWMDEDVNLLLVSKAVWTEVSALKSKHPYTTAVMLYPHVCPARLRLLTTHLIVQACDIEIFDLKQVGKLLSLQSYRRLRYLTLLCSNASLARMKFDDITKAMQGSYDGAILHQLMRSSAFVRRLDWCIKNVKTESKPKSKVGFCLLMCAGTGNLFGRSRSMVSFTQGSVQYNANKSQYVKVDVKPQGLRISRRFLGQHRGCIPVLLDRLIYFP